MPKKLSAVEKFYIEQHKDKMSAEELAKTIGCTSRTIYNHINKNKPGREINRPDEPAPLPPEPSPLAELPKGIQSVGVGVRKHGNSGAVVMTSEASQVGDEIMQKGPTKLPEYIHVIKRPDS